ncbi:MAG: hypothetical protein WCH04_18590 [Gammaproteobacteria bacterium]
MGPFHLLELLKAMKELSFAASFALLAYLGLEISLNISPVGVLFFDEWKKVPIGNYELHFAVPAFFVSLFMSQKVFKSKSAKYAFLWGAVITAVVAFLSGFSEGLLFNPERGKFALLQPFFFVAADVFLVSPFVLGGLLATLWWKISSNKRFQVDAAEPRA